MSAYQFTNNANTTLGSTLNSGSTTMTVATGTGVNFPSLSVGQTFTATIFAAGSPTGTPNEIVLVTARTGDTMTVIRGQEGTTDATWPVGSVVSNFLTAGFLNQLAGANNIQSQFGNSAVDTGSANNGAITLSPSISALSQILYSPIRVEKINAANTGAYTLNVNGIGDKNVLLNGSALQSGQLAASQIYEVAWDGTSFELLSFPAKLSSGSVTSTTIASGAVTSGAIAAGAVTSSAIASGAVTSSAIATGAVTSNGLAANSVTSAAIVNNTVANSDLAQMSAGTVKANLTGTTNNANDVTLSALYTALGFGTNSLSASGYYTASSGFTYQWGTATVAAGSSTTPQLFSFPVAFTTAYRIVVSWSQSKAGATSGNSVAAPTLTNTQYGLTCDDGSGPRTASWIAVGVI